MIIDFHTHIFPPYIRDNREAYLQRDDWFGLLYSNPRSRIVSAEELIASMDTAGIDKAVAFSFGWADPGLCRATNDYVIESVRRFPERLIGFACVSPKDQEAMQKEIGRCAEAGLRGVGELTPAGQGFQIEDSRIMQSLGEVLQHYRLPLLLHTNEPVGHEYPGKGGQAPWGIVRFAERFPGVTLICAHWGGGLFFYELMPELLVTLRNVFYDTSASPLLYRDNIFKIAMQIVPNKILFATDYPLIDQGRLVRRVRAVGLATVQERKLLSENAMRVLSRSEGK